MFNFRWGIISALIAFVLSIILGIISGVSFFYIIMRALLFAVVFFGIGTGIRFAITNFFPELIYGDDAAGTAGSDRRPFEQPGSRVNITVGNTGEYALPESYRTGGQEQELGNIEDLISGVFRPRAVSQGIDRETEDDYNEDGQTDSFRREDSDDFDMDFKIPDSIPNIQSEESKPEFKPVEKPAFTPSFGDTSGGLGGLPDLDSMAMAFTPGGGYSSPVIVASRAEPMAESLVQMDDVDDGMFAAGGSSGGSGPERKTSGNKPQTLEGDFNAEELAKGIRTILSKDK